jgi:hypothetical protein
MRSEAAVDCRVFLGCLFHVMAAMLGVAHLKDLIIMPHIFFFFLNGHARNAFSEAD